MERRIKMRRELTRGYSPERRMSDLPTAGPDLRHDQRRRKDRRRLERRGEEFPPFLSPEKSQFG